MSTMDMKRLPYSDIPEIDPYDRSSRIVIDMFNELDIPSLESLETNNNVSNSKQPLESAAIEDEEPADEVIDECDDSQDFYSLPSISDEESCSNLLRDDELSKIDINDIHERNFEDIDDETLPSAIVDLVEERSLKQDEQPHVNVKIISVNLNPFSQFKLPVPPQIDPSNLRCMKCMLKFKTNADFDTHKCYPRKKKIYSCELCTFKGDNYKKFKDHRLCHVIIYSCDQCSYQSKLRYLLSRHLKTHLPTKPLTCDLCQFSCKVVDGLNRHKLRMHSEETLHQCNKCDFSSRRIQVMDRHRRSHETYKCNKCDYITEDRDSLVLHSVSHMVPKEPVVSKCDKCTYTTIRAYDLVRHKSIHSNEKPYACTKCDYTSRDKAGLKAHLLTHLGIKPYSCDKCGYTCTLQTRLSTHKLTHNGPLPFACDTCNYRYKTKHALIKHKSTHQKN